jgi:ABC-type transport system substrate-binding protein
VAWPWVQCQAWQSRGERFGWWRAGPDINVLGHNVLQYLYEYALDRNELVPCLAVSRRWVDDTTLELKLREGVRFHNGESFDAYAVKFNFEYQRKHNLGRGVQVYMRNVQKIQVMDSHTVRIILTEPDALFLDKLLLGRPRIRAVIQMSDHPTAMLFARRASFEQFKRSSMAYHLLLKLLYGGSK